MRTELFWIDGPWPGRLAIMPRPRGGDWLEDEVDSWRRSHVDVVVSLLTSEEIAELELNEEETSSREAGIEFISVPVPDRGVPESTDEFSKHLFVALDRLAAGKVVAVHCRQGIGRAAIVAICLLILSGVELAEAMHRVGSARGVPVPETPEQRKWIGDFNSSLVSSRLR